jgi:hypothetical protein
MAPVAEGSAPSAGANDEHAGPALVGDVVSTVMSIAMPSLGKR